VGSRRQTSKTRRLTGGYNGVKQWTFEAVSTACCDGGGGWGILSTPAHASEIRDGFVGILAAMIDRDTDGGNELAAHARSSRPQLRHVSWCEKPGRRGARDGEVQA
jgi:hypothetical protein